MVNKDYILRMAEKFGRALAIILHLREYNRYEEALITVDDWLLQTTGLTSSFINSVSDEMLVQAISPLGILNGEKCLWMAVLLKAEGEIYEDQDKTNESYYRYLKSLHLYLLAISHEAFPPDDIIYTDIQELLNKLTEYELPLATKEKLFPYYERIGQYDKAEDMLFEVLEENSTFIEQGRAFYARLNAKNDVNLLQGNFSREEVIEGLAQLNSLEH
jgi:tetratricopeptide (TPR) repeat protein